MTEALTSTQKIIYEMGNVQRELESALLMGFSRLSERYNTNEPGTDKLGGMMHHGPTSCMAGIAMLAAIGLVGQLQT